MSMYSTIVMSLLSVTVIGCASDDVAEVGRAAVNVGLVAASAAGYGSLQLEDCELQKQEALRDECLRRNSEIKSARERANQHVPTGTVSVTESSSNTVKIGVIK